MGRSPDVVPTVLPHSDRDLIQLTQTGVKTMPRYVVERSFPDGLSIPMTNEGATACLQVVDKNLAEGVTWVHSYVSSDHHKTFCIYDGPSPDAIRKVAARNQLPVGPITEVQVLAPYFYR